MEKTKELNQLTIDVTELGLFNGLYESIWLNSDMDIDEVGELAEMLGVDAYDIDVSIDYNEYLKAIAELYIEMLENEIDSVGRFEVKELYHPREYNFDTDHIIINWFSELSLEEMESKLKELTDDNDDRINRNDWTIEEMVYDRYHGYELYDDMIHYKYNGHELYFNMDADDIARVKA